MRSACWFVLPLVACATSLPVRAPQPPPVAPLRLGADAHLHLTMQRAAHPLFDGAPYERAPSERPTNRWANQVDVPQLEAAGVHLALAALWPPFRARPGHSSLDEALSQVDQLEAWAAEHPRVAVVHSAAEARTQLARQRFVVLPQLEGGEGLTRVADVDRLYAAGVRCLTLVHFVSNDVGGAAAGQLSRALFGARSDAREPEGLTPLGRAVVERLIELGVVIDLAHASDALFDDVLSLTEARGVPVLVSHTAARALFDLERNLSDAQALRVARGGGLIGVTVYASQAEVAEAGALPAHVRRTCDDLVAHWVHLAQVVPAEALLLGSDLNGPIDRPRPGGRCERGLANTSGLGGYFAALEAEGVPRASLDDMGERLLRLFEAVEAKSSPPARAEALRASSAPAPALPPSH